MNHLSAHKEEKKKSNTIFFMTVTNQLHIPREKIT